MAPQNSGSSSSPSSPPLRIAIVGGGVIGVCSALALQDAFPSALEISLLSEKWSPQTTGDVSAGLIYPYAVGAQTPPSLLNRILADTLKFYARLLRHPSSGQIGISLLTMYALSREANPPVPEMPEEIPDIRRMSQKEVKLMFPEYSSGIACTTYIAEPALLLPFLMEKFQSQGGKCITRRITALSQLTQTYDLVINCTGLGSRYLSDVQDQTIEAVRGQVIRVRAPWVRHAVLAGSCYILPNRDCLILGGTKEVGNYNLSPDPETAERILADCCKVLPSLAKAVKVADCVGLRPYRPEIRIEVDPGCEKIIHNYGHGGSGVTLCWGSALEVVRLARESLRKAGLKSKL